MAIEATFLAVVLGVVAAVILAVFGAIVLVRLLKLIGFLVAHVARFIGGMFSDTFRFVGAIVLMVVLAPLVLGSVVIGRWSAAAHYGRAVKHEIKTACLSIYRVGIGHPFRLIGLKGVTEGLEDRLPQVIAGAPGPDKPNKRRVGMFDGYTIVGSLPGGGSGGRLYIAEPNELKRAAFVRQGLDDVDQVVIKSFSLTDGSSLPQIVRESRALDAAKKLKLVLEHELTDERFFYVMRYVPGESLSTLTTRMHGLSEGKGLDDFHLRQGLGYIADLLRALDTYHHGGLWHKDVKPDNIIVDGKQAHLVDFGLVTPLRSAMTLTTHGTEYFRDPELVRQALRGVKVHQIDGSKFDIYAAGAVLFSVLENSFPAHGGLSQITNRCPEAVRWIVRRAMTDYDKRYATAADMLGDLEAVLRAPKLFEVRPVDLPSVARGATTYSPEAESESEPIGYAAAGSPVPPPLPWAAPPLPQEPRPVPKRLAGRPKLKVTGWWSGRYNIEGQHAPRSGVPDDLPGVRVSVPGFVAVAGMSGGRPFFRAGPPAGKSPATPARPIPPEVRASASEQLRAARGRAAAKRRAAQQRVSGLHRRVKGRMDPTGINAGTVAGAIMGLFIFAAAGGLIMLAFTTVTGRQTEVVVRAPLPGQPTVVTVPRAGIPVRATPRAPIVMTNNGIDVQSLSPVDRRCVVLVSDLTPPLDAGLASDLESLLSGLIKAGGTLLGDSSLFLGEEVDQGEQQIELVAELEAARGQRPIDSVEVHSSVMTWLADHADVDAVLWISPTPKPSSGIQYSVFTSNSVISGQAHESLQPVLADAVVQACKSIN